MEKRKESETNFKEQIESLEQTMGNCEKDKLEIMKDLDECKHKNNALNETISSLTEKVNDMDRNSKSIQEKALNKCNEEKEKLGKILDSCERDRADLSRKLFSEIDSSNHEIELLLDRKSRSMEKALEKCNDEKIQLETQLEQMRAEQEVDNQKVNVLT